MRKSLLLLCVAALPTLAFARHLNPQEALTRASSTPMMKAPGKSALDGSTLAYSALANSESELYVFNTSNGGYVIVSADDIAYPVLGYSESGTFDPNNIPDNLQWWLDEYACQIAYAADNGVTTMNMAPSRMPNITPMLTCKWNQSSPFNDLCPEISGRKCVTGCVATAMAQVMYFHQWPPQGVGEYSYSCPNVGTLSLDFSQITYDWDAMVPVYTSSSSEVSKQAVAQLMYSCGVSMEMSYGVGASGAFSALMPRAFIENFNYDKGIQYLSRSYFSLGEWENLIYNELINSRPVLYDGQSGSGGHQFVCDGYADGYFHFNWGWGGMSDGYFLLTALNPNSQGIGGSTGGYNIDQNILIGLQKPQPDSKRKILMTTKGSLTTEKSSYSHDDVIKFVSKTADGRTSYFYNMASYAVNVSLGIKVTDAIGRSKYYKSAYSVDLQSRYGTDAFYLMFEEPIANGSYVVTPAFYDNNEDVWGDIFAPYLVRRPLIMTVTSDKINFTLDAGVDSTISVSDFSLDTPLYSGTAFKATATLSAEADFTTAATVAIFQSNSIDPVAWGEFTVLSFKAGVPLQLEYISKLSQCNYTPSVGKTYELQLVDSNFDPISERIPVVYQSAPTGTLDITVNQFTVGEGNESIPADNIRIQGKVTVNSGYMAGPLQIYLFPYPGGSSLTMVETPAIFAEAGQSDSFDFVWEYLSATPGNMYILAPKVNGSISNDLARYFTLVAPTTKEDQQNLLTFDYIEEYSSSTPTNTVAKDNSGNWHAAEIALVDAVQWYNPLDFVTNKLTYTRHFNHTDWSALYVPFEMLPSEWASYASSVIEYTGDTVIDGETVLEFKTIEAGETLQANHPYIFKPLTTGDVELKLLAKTVYATPDTDPCIDPIGASYALYGIYEIKDNMASSGAFALQNGNFYPTKNPDVTLSPFRVYLQPTSSVLSAPARISILVDNGTDGITDITTDRAADNVIYDLNGRRVDNPDKGIYILNGQKIYIK